MAAAVSSSSLRSAAGAGSCTTTSNDHLLYHPESISLLCSDGIILTGQSYKKQSTCRRRSCRRQRRILCLHGWMDNCRSYYYLAPHLLERIIDENDTSHQERGEDNGDADADDCRTDHNDDVHVVALDFPGHGQSSHFGPGRPGMVLAELIVYVAEALRALGWTTHHGGANDGSSNGGEGGGTGAIDATKNITLIGHSMGASVACLYAAAFPEQIDQLVLLEGVGPLARPALDTAKHVRKHVEKRLLSPTLYAEPRRYESLALAITARCRTARTWPGNQYLSEVAARQLVEYGTRKTTTAAATKQQPVMTSSDDNDDGTSTTTTTYYQFRHDPRLQWPSLQFFTPEQTDGVYQDIQCPTALILAADGWPFDETIRRRTIELLRPVYTVTLPGSHHWHMDPDTAPAVVEHVAQFLSRDP